MKTPSKKKEPAQKQKGRGGKLSRSEIVSVRFEPKLRYLAELASRKKRRTLSSFIEWLVEDSMQRMSLHYSASQNEKELISIQKEASKLWDVDESERFVRLAVLHPELLNQEEQEIWKLLNDSWLVSPAKISSPAGEITWDWRTLSLKVFPTVSVYWPSLKKSYTEGRNEEWVEETQKAVFYMKDYMGLVTDEYMQDILSKAKG